MTKTGFDFGNVAENEGVAISLVGMTIVFLGLALVSVFIAVLPKFLDWLDLVMRRKAEEQAADEGGDEANGVDDVEVAVAIAMVLQDALRPEDGSAGAADHDPAGAGGLQVETDQPASHAFPPCSDEKGRAMKEYHLKVNGHDYVITLKNLSGDRAEMEVDGEPYVVDIRSIHRKGRPKRRPSPTAQRGTTEPAPQATPPPNMAAVGAADHVTAPIPGAVLEVYVKEGDTVEAGEALLKMEAMKMENRIEAPREGTVAKVRVKAGDSVSQGQELIELK